MSGYRMYMHTYQHKHTHTHTHTHTCVCVCVCVYVCVCWYACMYIRYPLTHTQPSSTPCPCRGRDLVFRVSKAYSTYHHDPPAPLHVHIHVCICVLYISTVSLPRTQKPLPPCHSTLAIIPYTLSPLSSLAHTQSCSACSVSNRHI